MKRFLTIAAVGVLCVALSSSASAKPEADSNVAYSPDIARELASVNNDRQLHDKFQSSDSGELNAFDVLSEQAKLALLEEFWTPERMEQAQNEDVLAIDTGFVDLLHSEAFTENREDLLVDSTEPSYSIPPVEPSVIPGRSSDVPSDGVSTETGNANVTSGGDDSVTAYGKVYFINSDTGSPSTCSAAVVNSVSKRLVITAAHCVHSGKNGRAHKLWMFVPNKSVFLFQEKFGADRFFLKTSWMAHGAHGVNADSVEGYAKDYAFVRTTRGTYGNNIVDKVGGHGLTFGRLHNHIVDIVGYPNNVWAGIPPMHCSTFAVSYQTYGREFSRASGCDFGGGSSGGPWLKNKGSNGLGYIGSVTSFGPDDNSFIAGPVFDSEVLDLFEYAQDDWRK